MSQPAAQDHAGAHRPRRVARLVLVLAAYLSLLTARCTFPDYDTTPPIIVANAGKAGDGVGATTNGATSTMGGSAGNTTAVGGDSPDQHVAGQGGVPEATGGSPECAPEQWPAVQCPSGCLHRFPDHCYDGTQSGDEIAVDCGGACQPCTIEACTKNSDCLSGDCVADGAGSTDCYAPLTIKYTPQERNAVVGSTAWSLTLSNVEPDGGKMFKLNDVKIRYYFDHTGVVEPLIVRATQANITQASGTQQGLTATTWTVVRTENTADSAYDAYVEVAFGDSMQLLPGDHIDLYQQMLTGNPATSLFDQRLAYSFSMMESFANLHVTVLYQDQLVWGLEPRPANPRSCFVRAVNLNGPDVTVDGHAFQSAAAASVVVTGGTGVSQAVTTFPATTGGLATMLQTATRMQSGDSLSLPVDNGTYLLFLYGLSPGNDSMPSTFTVQGAEPDLGGKFRSQPNDGGQVWARMGPFRIDVTDGKLAVGVTDGAVTFTGLELWYPD